MSIPLRNESCSLRFGSGHVSSWTRRARHLHLVATLAFVATAPAAELLSDVGTTPTEAGAEAETASETEAGTGIETGTEAVWADELRDRRSRVLEAMRKAHGGRLEEDRAILVLRAPPPDHFAGDVDYPYRADNNLFYLTGVPQKRCALVMTTSQDDGHKDAVIFFDPIPERMQVWEGVGLSREAVARRSGLAPESVRPFEELSEYLASLHPAPGSRHARYHRRPEKVPFYMDTGAPFGPGEALTAPYAYLVATLGSNAFHIDLRAPGDLIHPLRQIKSGRELRHIRRAVDVTCMALKETMGRLREGIYEYEARAWIEATFVREGCRGWGFPPIVGSGPNSCVLHYQDDRRRSRPGELLLMDVGAEEGFYSADITRTVPLSGKFTPAQRQIYDVVLEAQEATIAFVKPGVTTQDINRVAREHLAQGLLRIGRIKDPEEARRYSIHGVTHGMGLAVHDPMPISPLEPGMVITIEPGLYFPEESIGIRIEDDILVTEDGAEVLSASLPKKAEEIERLVGARKL